MKRAQRSTRRRPVLGTLALILAASMLAPLTGYVYVAAAQEGEQAWQENPRAGTWERAREGTAGTTSLQGPYVTNELIQNGGENWRNLRNGPLATIMPWVMAASLIAIALVYTVFGAHRIEGPLSGRKVRRWNAWERTMHWFVAITFIILAITGLSLLFGRAVLIPLLGHQGFAAWAEVSKVLHNWVGPLFTLGILAMLIAWARNNLFIKADWQWFKDGGGIFKKKHVSAGKLNGGEKVWFWFVVLVGGVLVSGSGLVLDFPNFGQTRETMQLANLIHGVLSILWIALAFGHIYLGVIGARGALEGMTSGYVSEEWAYEHHDIWLEELKARGEGPEVPSRSGGTATGPADRPA